MARKGLWDLVFDPSGDAGVGPIGVMLAREFKKGSPQPAAYKGGFAAAEADDVETIQTVPIEQHDFSGGALYSRRMIDNGYAYMAPGYARSGRGVTPPGEVTTVTLPTPATALGAITDSYELGGDLYFLAGRYVLVCANGTATTLTVAQDLGVGFTADGCDVFNGAAYIGGTGGNIWKMTSAGVFSQSADVAARKAAVVTWLIPSEGVMLARIVMCNTALTGIMYTGGDPMSRANFTPNPSFIPVGDSSYLITGLVAAPNHFYIPKEDGLYDLNTRGETPNMAPFLRRTGISSRNGAASIYVDGYVHLGHVNGAHRLNVSRPGRQYVGDWTLPPVGVVNETPVVGPVTAWALDQGWLVAAVYNTSTGTSYIGAGRSRGEPGIPEGPGSMLWHFAEQVVTGEVTHLRQTIASDRPRLWVGSRDGADTVLSYQHLPNATNPTGEDINTTDFRFGTSMVIYTTPYDWNLNDTLKVLRLIGLRGDNLGVTAGIAVSANAEGGAYTTLATARTSPRTRITPRSPLTEGYEIGLKLEGSGLSTLPPVLRSIKLDAELQNEQFDRRTYEIRVGPQQPTLGGGEDKRNHAVVWRDITQLHREGVMEMTDQDGSTLNVRVHPIRNYTAVEDTAVSNSYTRAGLLSVTVLDVLAGAGLSSGAVWGDGSEWGSGSVWGAA
jgi:hypothetical protein